MQDLQPSLKSDAQDIHGVFFILPNIGFILSDGDS
jgi:hypothetical protein